METYRKVIKSLSLISKIQLGLKFYFVIEINEVNNTSTSNLKKDRFWNKGKVKSIESHIVITMILMEKNRILN